MGHLLTSNEVAAALGCSSAHVRSLCRLKKLVGVRVGKAWYVHRDNVVRFRIEQTLCAALMYAVSNGKHKRTAKIQDL